MIETIICLVYLSCKREFLGGRGRAERKYRLLCHYLGSFPPENANNNVRQQRPKGRCFCCCFPKSCFCRSVFFLVFVYNISLSRRGPTQLVFLLLAVKWNKNGAGARKERDEDIKKTLDREGGGRDRCAAGNVTRRNTYKECRLQVSFKAGCKSANHPLSLSAPQRCPYLLVGG